MTLTFGKYEGSDIKDIPTDYLEWLSKRTPRWPISISHILAAKHELQRRQQCRKD